MANNVTTGVVEGVLLYPMYREPALNYDKTKKEYKVSLAVTEEVADEWDGRFKKQPSKAFKNDEFEERFKIEPPFPEQKKQHVITIKRAATYKNGDELMYKHRPKLYVPDDDGDLEDRTEDLEIGNGSEGAVEFRATTNTYGEFAYLSNIRCDVIVERPQSAGGGGTTLGNVKSNEQQDEPPFGD